MRLPLRQTGGFRSARGRRNDGRALRAQFHDEAGSEALPGCSSALYAVDAVAPMLTIRGSSGVQHDIAVSGVRAGPQFSLTLNSEAILSLWNSDQP